MRRLRIVAIVALTAAFAAVAVPGHPASRGIGPSRSGLFEPAAVSAPQPRPATGVPGSAMTIEPLDPASRSDGYLDQDAMLFEPAEPLGTRTRPRLTQPEPRPSRRDRWRHDRQASWYGPGFIGNRTACGLTLTRRLIGVAHRTLPCGTRIAFRDPKSGRVAIAPVVDRGPYVTGRRWDLTYGLCRLLDHCYTGPLDWRYATGE